MHLDTVAPVILLTSLVAGNRVGGGVAAELLARAGFTPEHVPTVIFGRHPGLGKPGGGAVPDAIFADALRGLEANGNPARARAILTGYFASAAQVAAASRLIDQVRAANPDVFVLVDPICGDGPADASDGGLYIKPEVASAIRDQLLPRADLLTPNAFELSWLAGEAIKNAEDASRAAAALGKAVIVTSVPGREGWLGVITAQAGTSWRLETPARNGVPNGTGDVFAAEALIAHLRGASLRRAAQQAAAKTTAAIRQTLERGLSDLVLTVAAEDQDRPALQRVGAKAPAWVMGLDGCPGGWAAVLIDLNGIQAPRIAIHADIRAALECPERPHVIAVDMPIGFLDAPDEAGGREAERAARAILGPRRSSIFPSPLRPALDAQTYPEALSLNRKAGGPGLSKQAWNIFPKMREIDAVMTPALEGCVHEVHPEVSFTVLAGAPMRDAKRTIEGRRERLAVLKAEGLAQTLFDPHPFARKLMAPDDLLDAAACALTAVRLAEGEAVSFPANPPRDRRGLRMAIWA